MAAHSLGSGEGWPPVARRAASAQAAVRARDQPNGAAAGLVAPALQYDARSRGHDGGARLEENDGFGSPHSAGGSVTRGAVVTGLGAVSAAGKGTPALAAALREGRSCVRALEGRDGPSRAIGAPAPPLDAADVGIRSGANDLGRSALLFLAAAQEALAESHVLAATLDRTRIGIFEGAPLAGLDVGGRTLARLHGIGRSALTVSMDTVSTAAALALAVGQIRSGEIDVAVVGGGEAPLSPAVLASLGRAGLLSARTDDPATACRPFDATRDGTVLGEAGAALVMESMDHALRRGARIYAEVAAVSVTGDEGDISPCADVQQRARGMEAALRQGRTLPAEVEYVCAHGTATRANDLAETRALKAALGEHAYSVPVSAMKSMLGHTLAAAAALETVGAILAMNDGFVPPTINLSVPDPECDLDYVPGQARRERVNVALVCNASSGGRSTAILLRR